MVDIVVVMFWTGYASFIILCAILFFFGRVIRDSFFAKLLARRGFYCVDVLFPDNRWRSFFLKPKGSHFDIDDGYYLFTGTDITNKERLVAKVNLGLLKDGKLEEILREAKIPKRKMQAYLDMITAQKEEILKATELLRSEHGMAFKVEAVTLRYGIPTITYYWNRSEPINLKSEEKTYPAQVLKALMLRLLMDAKLKEVMKWLRVIALVLGGLTLLLALAFVIINNQNNSVQSCLGTVHDFVLNNVTWCKYQIVNGNVSNVLTY